MKQISLSAVILALSFQFLFAATGTTAVPYQQLNPHHFDAIVFPFVTLKGLNSSGDLPGDILAITGGSNLWEIVAGDAHLKYANSSLTATNIYRAGDGVMFGTESWFSKAILLSLGSNQVPSGAFSQLTLLSPTNDAAQVQIYLLKGGSAVNKLEIANVTNGVPANGAFTLTDLSPVPDLPGGVVHLVNGVDWLATNGCSIRLSWQSPDWWETGRWSPGSGGDTLWTTTIVSGVTNLQPINPDLTRILFTNNASAATPTLITVKNQNGTDADFGSVSSRAIVRGDQAVDLYEGLGFGTLRWTGNQLWPQLTGAILGGKADGSQSPNTPWGEVHIAADGILYFGTNRVISPAEADGTAIAKLGSTITHTSGNLFEVANNGHLDFGVDAGTGAAEVFGLYSNPTNFSRLSMGVFTNFGLSIIKPEYSGSGTNFPTNLRLYMDTYRNVLFMTGQGDPEGVVTNAADTGSIYLRSDAPDASNMIYRKFGTGTTGWSPIGGGGGGDTIWTTNVLSSGGISQVEETNVVVVGFTGYATTRQFQSLLKYKSLGTGSDNLLNETGEDVASTGINYGENLDTSGESAGGLFVDYNYTPTHYGLIGLSFPNASGQTNVAIAGRVLEDIVGSVTHVAGYFDHTKTYATRPVYQTSVLLIDNTDTGDTLITARTNNGATVFNVVASGLTTASAGFSSLATDTSVAISTTGWTNSFAKNAIVRFDGTAMTYTVYDNAGTSIYTNAVSLGHSLEILQPSGKIIITAGTGVTGIAAPF